MLDRVVKCNSYAINKYIENQTPHNKFLRNAGEIKGQLRSPKNTEPMFCLG
jgi:hypothetical protein